MVQDARRVVYRGAPDLLSPRGLDFRPRQGLGLRLPQGQSHWGGARYRCWGDSQGGYSLQGIRESCLLADGAGDDGRVLVPVLGKARRCLEVRRIHCEILEIDAEARAD